MPLDIQSIVTKLLKSNILENNKFAKLTSLHLSNFTCDISNPLLIFINICENTFFKFKIHEQK